MSNPIPVARAVLVYEDQVLLIQRHNNSDHFPGHWEIPGGKHDEDSETDSLCLQREILEECGIDLALTDADLTLLNTHVSDRKGKTYHDNRYLVRLPDGFDRANIKLDTTSHIASVWISSLDDLGPDDLMLDDIKETLRLAFKQIKA